MKYFIFIIVCFALTNISLGQDLKRWPYNGYEPDSIVIAKLNSLTDSNKINNDLNFIDAIEPLFYKESFYLTRPIEEWGYFFYDICIAETIISYYVVEKKMFANSPKRKVLIAIDSLLNDLAAYIGREVYHGSVGVFKYNLPNKWSFIHSLPSTWSNISDNQEIKDRNRAFIAVNEQIHKLYGKN